MGSEMCIRDSNKYLRYQMLILTHRGQEAADEHKTIFEASLARNVELAQQELKTHILGGLEHCLNAF